jgi:hypothetical protein
LCETMRSKKQKIADILLDLRVIETASRKAKFDGLLMLQKIAFVAAEKYKESHQRVLNQSFYRWDERPRPSSWRERQGDQTHQEGRNGS